MKSFFAKAICLIIMLALLPVCASGSQALDVGQTGEPVTVLTRRLTELGYMLGPATEYDNTVVLAVANFQTASALTRTGAADEATQQALYSSAAVSMANYLTSYMTKYKDVVIDIGVSGAEVTALQNALTGLGYYSDIVDGSFGEATRRSLSDYQRANGLNPTGIVDSQTLIRLYDGASVSRADYVMSQCAIKGDVGAKVKLIQARLSSLNYFSGDFTGTYGDITERAVSQFQRDNSLDVTGEVDSVTYEILFSKNVAQSVDEGALAIGDSGDDVFSLEKRLSELGYFEGSPDGLYGRSTETAIILFRLINEFEPSAVATTDVMTAIFADTAIIADDLEHSLSDMTEEGASLAVAKAEELIGETFEDDEELFSGFEFVRYVFALAGAAIITPADIIDSVGPSISDYSGIEAGRAVVIDIDSADTLTRMFAVSLGAGEVAYVDLASHIVSRSYLSDMSISGVYIAGTNNGQ